MARTRQVTPIVVFVGILFSTFLLEDPTTLAVGALIAKGEMTFLFGFAALSIGIFFGDLGLYGVGYLIKRNILSSKRTFFSPSAAQIALARFLPGARTVTFLASGFESFPLKLFLLIVFPSSIIWTLLLLSFTDQIFALSGLLPAWGNWLLGLVVFVMLTKLRTLMKLVAMATLISVLLVHHRFFIDRRDQTKISKSLSFYCKLALRILDVEVSSDAPEDSFAGHLVVSNHMSYLDVICLSSEYPGLFITSTEIQKTPVLGLICDLCGCLFTERRRSLRGADLMEKELGEIQSVLSTGGCLTLFPEGTSTNGQRILPFKTALFEVAFRIPAPVKVVVLDYESIRGESFSSKNADTVCWYGTMTFLPHFIRLCDSRNIKVCLRVVANLDAGEFSDRKAMASEAHRLMEVARERRNFITT